MSMPAPADVDPPPDPGFDAVVAKVLESAFISSSIGMPTEDPRTAMDVLWASYEALFVVHFPAGEGTPGPPVTVPDSTHWTRMLVTAVTNGLVLSGAFVRPGDVARRVHERDRELRSGALWHTRRPVGPGAVVLAVHRHLLQLHATAENDTVPGPDDAESLRELVVLTALAAALSRPAAAPAPGEVSVVDADRAEAEVADRAREVAVQFGVPGVQLVPVQRSGWACDVCGCVFTGRVEGGMAYPDRLAPVGRGGPCDQVTHCACHRAPVQRRVD